jgi:hypothetical protein
MCCLDWGLGSRRPGLFPMIGESIFTQESGWADLETFSRATVSPVCANTIPRCEVFDRPVNDLLAGLSSSNGVTGVVDLQPFFFRFTRATTTSLIFGEPSAGLDRADREIFKENFDYRSLISAMPLRLANRCWLYSPLYASISMLPYIYRAIVTLFHFGQVSHPLFNPSLVTE